MFFSTDDEIDAIPIKTSATTDARLVMAGTASVFLRAIKRPLTHQAYNISDS